MTRHRPRTRKVAVISFDNTLADGGGAHLLMLSLSTVPPTRTTTSSPRIPRLLGRTTVQHATRGLLLLASLILFAVAEASSQAPVIPVCGVSVPAEEALGFTPIPRGVLFCPILADPKEPRSFASFQRGTQPPIDTDIGAVGLGDSFGVVRWGGPRPGEGFQIGIVGSIFAQFDLNTPSTDLINADYIIGVTGTFRRGGFSTRARVQHQSSHLGDEYLLREQRPERENLSFEAVNLLLSHEVGFARAYAGGEYLFNREPDDLARSTVQGGLEIRQMGALIRVGNLGSARFIAGADLKASEEQDWSPGTSVRAGLEVGRARVVADPSRRWQLLGEFYTGPMPYGQFFRDNVRYFGLGTHFSL
jgi:hypothetical protein